jgi:hypothetical protein
MIFSYLIKITFLIFFLIAGFIGDAHTKLSKVNGVDNNTQILCTWMNLKLNGSIPQVLEGVKSCPHPKLKNQNPYHSKEQYTKCPRKNYKSPGSYHSRQYQRVPYFRNFYEHYFRTPEGNKHKYLCPYLYKRC